MPTSDSKILSFRFTQDSFVFDSVPDEISSKQNPVEFLFNFCFREKDSTFDNSALFLHSLADKFFIVLSKTEGLELSRENTIVPLTDFTIDSILNEVPFALGWEFIDSEWIKKIWSQLNSIFSKEISDYQGTVQMYLAEKNQHLKVGEKIFFHLVENPDDEKFPFAFLATYSTKNENGKISHLPLKFALTEFKNDQSKILNLLSCLNKAGESSPLIASFMDSGEMFHPLKLKSDEAWQLLKSIPAIEESGIVCRIPDWWKKNRHKVQVSVKIGEKKESLVGIDSIIGMQGFLEVDGVQFTKKEIKELLQQTEGLSFIKGKWVEVNHQRLSELLSKVENYSKQVNFVDALRMTLDIDSEKSVDDDSTVEITNGAWLKQIMSSLRNPDETKYSPSKNLNADLRSYQKKGFSWLYQMSQLRLGACLADDMGLGKTVQVLAFLEQFRTEKPDSKNLLVVPASLLGNWQNECKKFAPKINFEIIHGKQKNDSEDLLEKIKSSETFLFITTYGIVAKNESLKKMDWDILILDEAQAIKNPGTQQTKNIKSLKSKFRIAMTGTPIENDLSNLWSLFDFLNKGLLGNRTQFSKFAKSLSQNPQGYSKLKNMISPFMLRRLKTDKKIISDLPEKMEMIDYVSVSKKQAMLYKKFLDNLEQELQKVAGTEQQTKRRALVLTSLMKLKQICNHPDQYLGNENYSEKDSGKFEMLREICQTIFEKRERVLIFTQFKEITEHLDDFLSEIFGRRGFVLHGGTSVKKRNEMVQQFQSDEYIPYMVLSVKAGGTGLTLTNANHVIHFDRWWNPAVENQATDRAFRIGQNKNVMVHKLVCRGTIEEKIDQLIESKKELAQNVIGESGEAWITKMSDEELMNLMRME